MINKEKILKGLECCQHSSKSYCNECPYIYEGLCNINYCTADLASDVLDLLKEQEIGHWISLENCSNSGVYCSECHTKVFDSYPFKKKFSFFCPHCGTRMEGETERL